MSKDYKYPHTFLEGGAGTEILSYAFPYPQFLAYRHA